jgi:hypothetical protein
MLNSYLGGYWLELTRDGKDRFAPERGGLSLTDALMWQPRFGHCSLGYADSLGIAFVPLIQIDQAWFHPTHYLSDTNFDVWLHGLSPAKVHPRFRQDFIKQSGKRRANLRSALDARTPVCFHIVRHRPGASESER